MSFFLISGLTSANKLSDRSDDILKHLRKKKKNTMTNFLSYIFHLESGDLERLFGTKKMWISKIQKLEPCKFYKHLFLMFHVSIQK